MHGNMGYNNGQMHGNMGYNNMGYNNMHGNMGYNQGGMGMNCGSSATDHHYGGKEDHGSKDGGFFNMDMDKFGSEEIDWGKMMDMLGEKLSTVDFRSMPDP